MVQTIDAESETHIFLLSQKKFKISAVSKI